MKNIKKMPAFVSNSNNTRALKPMNYKEVIALRNIIAQAQSNGLRGFVITFTVRNNATVYAFKTTDIEAIVARAKTNTDSNGKTMFKIFSPLSLAQLEQFINDGTAIAIGTKDDLQKIRDKHNLKNNGQAVEWLVKRNEHTTVNHTQSFVEGGDDFNGYEIKFFDYFGGSSPSCRLVENITVD